MDIASDVAKLDKKMRLLNEDLRDNKTPAEGELISTQERIRMLNERKASLGVFSAGEKMRIDQTMASLNAELPMLIQRANAEVAEKEKKANEAIAKIREERDAMNLLRDDVSERIKVIIDKLANPTGEGAE